jgi:hypothetical protein
VILLNTDELPMVPKTDAEVDPAPPAPTVTVYVEPTDIANVLALKPPAPPPPPVEAPPPPPPPTTRYSTLDKAGKELVQLRTPAVVELNNCPSTVGKSVGRV